METIRHEIDFAGRKLFFETGKFAKRALTSVVCGYGETIVLAVLTVSREKSKANYMPLLVDYREKLYAGGKIKGSRWMKREGRQTDGEILLSRVIDRSIRPMIDKNLRNDVAINIIPLSVDKENETEFPAFLASAMATLLSGLPFSGPLSITYIGLKNNKFIVNPTLEEKKENDMLLTLSTYKDKVVMVEFEGKEIPEEKIQEAMKFSFEQNAILDKFQEEFKERVNFSHSLELFLEEPKVSDEEKPDFTSEFEKIYATNVLNERDRMLSVLQKSLPEESTISVEELYFEFCRRKILNEKKRIGGRSVMEVRPLEIEVGILPRVHGSGHFRRGETEALTTCTLGSPGDAQFFERSDDEGQQRFFHFYNFPSYSVGETAPKKFLSRREIGHGALAEKALKNMIPEKSVFPYTIQLVTEILTSNGSTSQAATCGSTLALMDAGVPIKNPVAGIAVGLIQDPKDENNFVVLTDIQGEEDHLGDMDFKVGGTENGVTAIQMDTKLKGVSMKVIEEAFVHAKNARLHILSEMKKVISAPNKNLSQYAPRIEIIKIDPEKIRLIIGKGGETIQKITTEANVQIDIEDDGTLFVTSENEEGWKKANAMIQDIVYTPKIGDEFEGVVARVEAYGAFVDGEKTGGLIHVSKLGNNGEFVKHAGDVVKVGQKLKVKVAEIDDQGRVKLEKA